MDFMDGMDKSGAGEGGFLRTEFAFIDFRDTAVGRQAFIQGSSLAVWEVMLLGRHYRHDVKAVAQHLEWPEAKAQAAFNYARSFKAEIDQALTEQEEADFEALSRMLPGLKEFVAE